MNARCYRKNHVSYKNYGQKGITVCDEWRNDFLSFYDWAIQNGYCDNLTLDRCDNSKGYSSENCRWATIREQNLNKSHPPRKCKVEWEIDGVQKSALEWCKQYNLSYQTVSYRIARKKMTPKEALTTIRLPNGRPRKEI
jgi:hypothetical protein